VASVKQLSASLCVVIQLPSRGSGWHHPAGPHPAGPHPAGPHPAGPRERQRQSVRARVRRRTCEKATSRGRLQPQPQLPLIAERAEDPFAPDEGWPRKLTLTSRSSTMRWRSTACMTTPWMRCSSTPTRRAACCWTASERHRSTRDLLFRTYKPPLSDV
jgi:hypothetical protein